MSLHARAINNENAGVPRAQNLKPGEAPIKQTGPIKRKGLSEMGNNQQQGSRGLSAAPKVTVRRLNCWIPYSASFLPPSLHSHL